ncbi:dynein heavy chain [Chlorella sorokiniana]|uniref:Dynein heavy chain n=1 Tax=Chlorella sorokiniana TaxID=3076 RepID=A0A2P6TYX5_CHLSO|nr:dynein heavy chain [Chlorella sorokiniana]|eukprot:PRW59277.1 dynein heavy chain [Chlorella sorokiniana]
MAAPSGLFSVETVPGWCPLGPEAQRKSQARRPVAAAAAAPAPSDAGWVKTDEDVAAYFERGGAVEFFYCIRADDAAEAEPAAPGCVSWEAAAAEFFLKVVPQDRVARLQRYYIISRRQVVKVDKRKAGGEHTDAVPLAEWLRHKRAFLRLRQLTFFGSFGLAKCFALWRSNAQGRVLLRRRHQLSQRLFAACPAFAGPLGQAGALMEQLRGARAACVQPRRTYSAADWEEQQAAWRTRKAKPALEAAASQLARVAEGVCASVEAAAEEALATVQPHELSDRIGVDLYAASTKAKARSMQAIKHDKVTRAQAYHTALANRHALPRFLRQLDLRLATALAEGAAASVADAATALQGAAPGLLQQPLGGVAEAGCASDGEEEGQVEGPAGAGGIPGSSPLFLVHVVLEEGGGVGFQPSEAQWAALMEDEMVGASLQLAGSVPPLLTLPAFERYNAALLAGGATTPCADGAAADGAAAEQSGQAGLAGSEEQDPQQVAQHASAAAESAPEQPAPHHRHGAAELAQLDGGFVSGTATSRALLARSFAEARRLAQRYQRYQEIQQYCQEFDFAAWEAAQRAELDLPATEAALRQLQAWQAAVEAMPLQQTAGLLRLDATGLQSSLAPAVASTLESMSGLLLQLAGERCAVLLSEQRAWAEVAAARPPELEGFLAWAAELARMQEAAAGQAAAAAHADAALEVVLSCAGRLPPAEAVRKDDLREAAAQLPAQLGKAAAWAAEQRGVHAVALGQMVREVAEEAVLLEAELQTGMFVDPGATADEVLGELDLQQSRTAQLAAQAGELASVARELTGTDGALLAAAGGGKVPAEVQDAEAAVQRCTALWGLVAEAEVLRDGCSPQTDQQQEGEAAAEAAAAPPPIEQTAERVAALQERLAGLRGSSEETPSAVWLRASSALLACKAALAG